MANKLNDMSLNTTTETAGPTWRAVVSFLCRFGLAAMWLLSGSIKLSNFVDTQQSIAAYELFPQPLHEPLALTLVSVELILGVLLLLGLFLRPVAIATGIVMLVFIAGIISAWARGLTIDCGCFGTGGYDASVGPQQYMLDILRDIGFMLMAAWTFKWPFRRLALHP